MSYLSLKEGADLGNFISTCDAAAARTIGLHLLFCMHRDCIQNQQGIAEAQEPEKQGGLPGGRGREGYSGVRRLPFPDLLSFLPVPKRRRCHHKGTWCAIDYNCRTLLPLTTSCSVFILVIHCLVILLSFLQGAPHHPLPLSTIMPRNLVPSPLSPLSSFNYQ